ncbi:MAG: wapA 2, partial [Pedosphaera sp.]|nr:wapA 2 [Pedosphaera sp.]
PNIHSTLTYSLVAPLTGMSISPSGVFTWTPTQAQAPSTNLVTTVVTNTNPFDLVSPHLSATNSFTVIVFAPTLAAISNFTVNAGQTVSFTAVGTDNDNTRTLTYSLGGTPPANASINSASGLFIWRTPASSAGTVTNIQVRVTDNSAPTLSAAQSFSVTVNALSPVTLHAVTKTNSQFQVRVSGPVGPDYILQVSGTVTNNNWVNLLTNTPGVSPFTLTDTNVGPFTNRFYRVKLAP